MAKPVPNDSEMPFTGLNYKALVVGIVVIILGYILMSGGGSGDPDVFDADTIFSPRRITVAPIVTLIGYMLIIYSILVKPRT